MNEAGVIELERRALRPGFRLVRLEVFNWGTFHERVWALETRGDNTLLTGDIGSGKSTLVDALTTLLVPPNKLAYNKAAGAEAKERTLRSYVLGFYKSERGAAGGGTRAVALRDRNSYSVILARFTNDLLGQTVTLAQVFWTKDVEGQPARLFVVADAPLAVKEHFAGFGADIGDLRRRLRRSGFELYDSFPPYGSAFRRRFGIDSEQALELFHQTVSMKSVGNLTEFVRQHMLQAFQAEDRIIKLIDHFDDLSRAHEAVLKAREQIARLEPLIEDCDRHAALSAQAELLRAGRDALRPWFARAKATLLERRIEKLGAELARLEARVGGLDEKRAGHQGDRDEVKRAIAENGGDRVERLKAEVARKKAEMGERRAHAEKYARVAQAVGLPAASDAEVFAANRAALDAAREEATTRLSDVQNAHTEAEFEFRALRGDHNEVTSELASLRQRRSNIPARMLELRTALCEAVDLPEDALPFAGELLQVRDDEKDWEGAIERVLHGFGLSLLVQDGDYAAVAQWVDRTHLRGRLVYYRVRARPAEHVSLSPESLVRKLVIKPDSQAYAWLEAEVARRFDYICCDALDQFRREKRAITRTGQTKDAGERHEKDDRHSINDRSRYVLGWSNEAKISAFVERQREIERRMQAVADRIAERKEEQSALNDQLRLLSELAFFEAFRSLDWKPLAVEIEALETERRTLESGSDILRALGERLQKIEAALRDTEADLEKARDERSATRVRRENAGRQRDECVTLLAETAEPVKARFAELEPLVKEMLGEHALTVESCDNRERDVRDKLQSRIDAEDAKIRRLAEKVVQSMQAYRNDYPLETREADARVAAADEYRTMLNRLRGDDLPRFETRFKELLNVNTIREVANFQSQLFREQQTIRERIETINKSLRDIDYNPGRYIVLDANPTNDAEIREFQKDLRACTEGALTGSEDDAYSEAKFLQVKRIVERFRGRDGSAEVDKRWTAKVTDVRSWFTFSASERWREDDREHEHYTDSGGKSGGQKEKLAYTVLAASLAYQFGLEWGAPRPRSFRFVVIDEAFGRGSDESTRYGLELFERLELQLLIVTPLQKIHVIEPHVASVGFVHNEAGRQSMLRNLTIEQYRAERAARSA